MTCLPVVASSLAGLPTADFFTLFSSIPENWCAFLPQWLPFTVNTPSTPPHPPLSMTVHMPEFGDTFFCFVLENVWGMVLFCFIGPSFFFSPVANFVFYSSHFMFCFLKKNIAPWRAFHNFLQLFFKYHFEPPYAHPGTEWDLVFLDKEPYFECTMTLCLK